MKVISVGDSHGSDYWKSINHYEWDLTIFVGDYVDSSTHSNCEILHNLKEIIQLKKDNLDNVILLWGNHDIHYLCSQELHKCSGYRGVARFDLYEIFNNNKDLFTYCYQRDNCIWTHAGISLGWWNHRLIPFVKKEFPDIYKWYLHEEQQKNIYRYSSLLNMLFEYNCDKVPVLYDVGYIRGGLCRHGGGPLWFDRRESKKMLEDPDIRLHQIAGHTHISNVTTIINKTNTVTWIDTGQEQLAIMDIDINQKEGSA